MKPLKKILILILLLCCGSKAYSQLPEPGWTKGQVEKFMEGKYRFKSIDTSAGGVEIGPSEIFRYAPVSLYGIEGMLSIMYNYNSDNVKTVIWDRGPICTPNNKAWVEKKTLAKLSTKLSHAQTTHIANLISKVRGKPVVRTEKDDLLQKRSQSKLTYTDYYWEINNHQYELRVNRDSTVEYQEFKEFY